ncbi:AAA family ATPase [Alloyangia pacifica]|uniref:AAA family ATPase n=1 Tax=Alloyangia pacifica TaxID=311180 RepID=UPI001FE10DCD|nr:AAA family ATPase [Alloyangia pacifica]
MAHERPFLRPEGRSWVAGKTSLITELARRGLHTIPESGRAIIREGTQSGGDALPSAGRMAKPTRTTLRRCRFPTAEAWASPEIGGTGARRRANATFSEPSPFRRANRDFSAPGVR